MRDWLEPGALLLRDLGFMLYGGPMVAFAALVAAQPRVPGLPIEAVLRAFRAWGPGFGLSLGASVLGALVGWWARTGAMQWGTEPLGRAGTVAWLLFLALWASNIRLEVWTLEPTRRADPPAGPLDASALAAAARPLRWHLALQALLVLAAAAAARLAEAG